MKRKQISTLRQSIFSRFCLITDSLWLRIFTLTQSTAKFGSCTMDYGPWRRVRLNKVEYISNPHGSKYHPNGRWMVVGTVAYHDQTMTKAIFFYPVNRRIGCLYDGPWSRSTFYKVEDKYHPDRRWLVIRPNFEVAPYHEEAGLKAVRFYVPCTLHQSKALTTWSSTLRKHPIDDRS